MCEMSYFMFGRSKGIDPNQLIITQRMVNAEIGVISRKEQGNFDAACRNCAKFIDAKNKAQALATGKKILEAKNKVDAATELLKFIVQLKDKAENIAKNQMDATCENIVVSMCCGADFFKTDGLTKFKTQQMKDIFKSKASEHMKPEKLPEPLKILFSTTTISELEVISAIREHAAPFVRDSGAIDSLFGAAPTKQEIIASKTPVLEASKKDKFVEHVDLFTITNCDVIPIDRWNTILSAIQ